MKKNYKIHLEETVSDHWSNTVENTLCHIRKEYALYMLREKHNSVLNKIHTRKQITNTCPIIKETGI